MQKNLAWCTTNLILIALVGSCTACDDESTETDCVVNLPPVAEMEYVVSWPQVLANSALIEDAGVSSDQIAKLRRSLSDIKNKILERMTELIPFFETDPCVFQELSRKLAAELPFLEEECVKSALSDKQYERLKQIGYWQAFDSLGFANVLLCNDIRAKLEIDNKQLAEIRVAELELLTNYARDLQHLKRKYLGLLVGKSLDSKQEAKINKLLEFSPKKYRIVWRF